MGKTAVIEVIIDDHEEQGQSWLKIADVLIELLEGQPEWVMERHGYFTIEVFIGERVNPA